LECHQYLAPLISLSIYYYLPTDGQTVEELELDRLALSNGTETTVLDTFSIKLNSVFGELETLLDKSGQFTNATTLLTKNVLGVSGTNDDSKKANGVNINILLQYLAKNKTHSVRAGVTRTSTPA
jgi:hypothetical protein